MHAMHPAVGTLRKFHTMFSVNFTQCFDPRKSGSVMFSRGSQCRYLTSKDFNNTNKPDTYRCALNARQFKYLKC